MIYLDNNATTALDDRVLEAMLPFLSTHYGNPSSLYRQGRIARSALDTAREQIAQACSTSPNQIIFTSGGTESNHLALNSLSPKSSLAISTIEHASIAEPAQILKRQGISLQSIGVNKEGVMTPAQLESIFATQPPDLISIMHGNNETGVIQDIRFISEQCKALNVKLHTDASQTFGKIPVSFSNLGVDLMSISSHKIYGLKDVAHSYTLNKINSTPCFMVADKNNNYVLVPKMLPLLLALAKPQNLLIQSFNNVIITLKY